MELSKIEQGITVLTVRGCSYFDELISMEYLKQRVRILDSKYPWLHYRVENNQLFEDGAPVFYEKVFPMENKLDFVSTVMSDCYSSDIASFWLCSMEGSKSGALVVVVCHSFTDGPNIGHFLSDLISNEQHFVSQGRYDWKQMIENIEENLQAVDTTNMLSVAPNPSPSADPIFLRAKVFSYDPAPLLSFCKKHGVRPQSVFSAAELYSIIQSLPHPDEFGAVNLISCNARSHFGLPEDASLFASSGVYTRVEINSKTKILDTVIDIHNQLHQLIPKHVKGVFRANSLGTNNIVIPTASISNIGRFNTPHKDIWIQGGMSVYPEFMRPLRNFTFHGVTTGGQLNIVCTYLVPGCDEDFITIFTNHFNEFLTNIEGLSSKTFF